MTEKAAISWKSEPKTPIVLSAICAVAGSRVTAASRCARLSRVLESRVLVGVGTWRSMESKSDANRLTIRPTGVTSCGRNGVISDWRPEHFL